MKAMKGIKEKHISTIKKHADDIKVFHGLKHKHASPSKKTSKAAKLMRVTNKGVEFGPSGRLLGGAVWIRGSDVIDRLTAFQKDFQALIGRTLDKKLKAFIDEFACTFPVTPPKGLKCSCSLSVDRVGPCQTS